MATKSLKIQGYYIRNEARDPQGRSLKDEPLDDWKGLMDKGLEWRRGYQPGDQVTVVNTQPVEFFQDGKFYLNQHQDCLESGLAERMWCKFNRGSGEELEFPGPSMCIGDLVLMVSPEFVHFYQAASVGFFPVEDPAKFLTLMATPQIKALLPPDVWKRQVQQTFENSSK